MNNERRKQIDALLERLKGLQEEAAGIQSDLEDVQSDEQDYYDAMPESFQNSEKGERAMAALDAIQEAINAIESFDIDGIISSLETAKE